MRLRSCNLYVLLLMLCPVAAFAAKQGEPDGLFPLSPSIASGHLKVSDLHEVWYSVHGNPEGLPVFVLHGGPGVGCYPRLVQYFDPTTFMIVLHDQRGAGQSKPAGEIRENTTQDLVEDIERLRKHLKIDEQIIVFGGSWGTTLGLAYAEAYPDQVRGMILRGVFMASDDEPLNGFVGPMPRAFFPDAVAEFEQAVKADCPEMNPQILLKVFQGDDKAKQKRVARAWVRCAMITGRLHASEEMKKRDFGDYDFVPGARIDCHYAVNGFFLKDNALFKKLDVLDDIPVTIINGRYDLTCPPVTAWTLHKALPKSKLVIVEEAGHSEAEPGTTKALLEAVKSFEPVPTKSK